MSSRRPWSSSARLNNWAVQFGNTRRRRRPLLLLLLLQLLLLLLLLLLLDMDFRRCHYGFSMLCSSARRCGAVLRTHSFCNL